MKRKLLLMGLGLLPAGAMAQTDIYDMDLESLMSLDIVSVSKTEESAFDAPLSSTVITRQEIFNSGATSIVEALRLVPGMVVREQTNGVYSAHLRGLDNAPPGGFLSAGENSSTLVMVDGVPVFSYFQGGTFWETLPVSLSEVESIEVVRGPASALYGANAVSGVINILTSRENRSFARSSLVGGTHGSNLATAYANLNRGFWNASISQHYEARNRYDTDYFLWRDGSRVASPDSIRSVTGRLLDNPDERYPRAERALGRKMGKASVAYRAPELGFSVGAALEEAQLNRAYVETQATPFTMALSETRQFFANGYWKGLTASASYIGGTQNAALGINGWKYDLGNLFALLEYDWRLLDGRLALRPGLNYQSATYDDGPYAELGFLNGKKTLSTLAPAFRADFRPVPKLRLVAAYRADFFSQPDKAYHSYQFAATFAPAEGHLLRLATARANKSAFMADAFNSFEINRPIGFDENGAPNHYFQVFYRGNPEADLLSSTLYELGYRWRPGPKMSLDLEAFASEAHDFMAFTTSGEAVVEGGIRYSRNYVDLSNLPTRYRQSGASLSATYASSAFYLRLFGTFQKGRFEDHVLSMSTLEINEPDNLEDRDQTATPEFFGGFMATWKPAFLPKFNFSASGYFAQASVWETVNFSESRPQGHVEIPAMHLLNLRAGYMMAEKVELFFMARNLFSGQNVQHAQTDFIEAQFWGGIHLAI